MLGSDDPRVSPYLPVVANGSGTHNVISGLWYELVVKFFEVTVGKNNLPPSRLCIKS